MTRPLLALCCAAAVLVSGAAPMADAAPRKAKARKVCVIKKPGRKPVRRLCRAPVKKQAPAARRGAAAPAPGVATPALDPFAPATGAPGADTPAQSTPATTGGGDAGAPCSTSPWLGATASDNGGVRLLLSRACVPAGQVLVQLRNIDEQPHNLYVEGVAPAAPAREVVGDIDAQVTAQGSVDLAAGRWRFFCAIAGHEAMTATVTAG